jgi:hypothetical protein
MPNPPSIHAQLTVPHDHLPRPRRTDDDDNTVKQAAQGAEHHATSPRQGAEHHATSPGQDADQLRRTEPQARPLSSPSPPKELARRNPTPPSRRPEAGGDPTTPSRRPEARGATQLRRTEAGAKQQGAPPNSAERGAGEGRRRRRRDSPRAWLPHPQQRRCRRNLRTN